jgi:hypothetical protein
MPSNTDLAPSNDFSGDIGWPGNEEMDNVWPRDDGENYYSPKDDRPREKSVWWKLLNMFKKQQPMSKKDIVPVKEASNLSHAYWVDPAGKVYTVRPNNYSMDLLTHSDWVVANQELLKEQYGLNLDVNCFKIIEEMYTTGWARIGDSGQSDMGYGITVGSLSHIPKGVDIALAKFYKGEELIVEGYFEKETVFIDDPFPSLQQAVNKALQQKRMQTAKQASAHGYGGWISPTGQVILAKDHGWAILEDPKAFGINTPIDKNHVSWQRLYEALYNEGWLRFRIWGGDLLFSGSSLESAKKAEDIIFNELDSVREITLDLKDLMHLERVQHLTNRCQ